MGFSGSAFAQRMIDPTTGEPKSVLEAEADPDDKDKPVAGFDDGFFIQNPNGPDKLTINLLSQFRYSFRRLGATTSASNFSVNSARLILHGKVLSEDLGYKFALETGRGFIVLKDAYANYAFTDEAAIRVGQYKKPFDRQELTSASLLMFVSRGPTTEIFGAGRDIGVMIHNGAKPGVEYAAGLFNGTGIDPLIRDGEFTDIPSKFEPEAVVRIGYNTPHIVPYEASDLQYGPLAYSIAASGAADFDMDPARPGNVRAEVDALIKYQGFSGTGSFFIKSDQDGSDYFDQTFTGFGAYVQAGYVIKGLVEPAFRYTVTTLRPTNAATGRVEATKPRETTTQLAAAINLYFFGQSLKWQNEGTVDFTPRGRNRYAWLSQLQMAF
jgi:hypothetical protein